MSNAQDGPIDLNADELACAAWIARFLKARGVDRVFGLQGGHIQPIWDRIARLGIRIVDVRDEGAAVHMAHAHAELTGQLGVAIVGSVLSSVYGTKIADFMGEAGLPAKAIDWGRWEGEGMAGTLTPAQQARVDARGIAPMPADAALAMLDAALASPETRLVIAAFDRARLAAAQPPPVLERYITEITEASVDDPADAVAAIVARVLGRPVEPGRPLTAYGLDSLMAVDLRNRLNRTFGASLQLADLLSGMDLDELGARVGIAAAEQVEVMTL